VAELTPDVRALFDGPNYGHVATLMADGSPHSAAVWVGIEDEHIVFFTQPESPKARNLGRDPRVAISVTDQANPYRTGRIRGRLVATREGDAALEVIDRLALKYTGQPFPMRSGVVFEIEPEKVSFMELPFQHTPAG
jgi:PPOX class probable F420-dependent enzyme